MSDTTVPSRTGGGDVPEGLISGAVFRSVRTGLGMTQAGIAEALHVDPNTTQGWETGRRALTSMRVADYQRARRRLQLLRADPEKLAVLDQAATADLLLADMHTGGDGAAHPLGTQVTNRTLTELLAWPLTGTPPRALGELQHRHLLPTGSRDRLALDVQYAADSARGDSGPLLRRQAYFLLAQHPTSRGWLEDTARNEDRTQTRLDAWSPQWVAARSLAVSRSIAGDLDPLRRFIARGLQGDDTHLAHLTYWAYWVGELPALWTSDEDMTGRAQTRWTGEVLAASLARNLDPAVPYRDLAVHALWALLTARRDLLADATLRDDITEGIDRITSTSDTVTADSRSRLDQIAYALRR
jgi:DNA-binding transcriptional regulator YiaG